MKRRALTSLLLLGGAAPLLSGCPKAPPTTPRPPPSVTDELKPRVPFGSRPHPYAPGTLLPSASPPERDRAVRDFYDAWSATHLKSACQDNQLVVRAPAQPDRLTLSRAHGYGMIILALMAGHDSRAKRRFDAMVRFHHEHPSRHTSGLMAEAQDERCQTVGGGGSATDGDFDIAYAYLLADAQWGSRGEIDYLAHAHWVLAALSRRGLHGRGIYPLLGDWVTRADRNHYSGARPADCMTDHFRTFAARTTDPVWPGLIDNVYWILETLQLTAASQTGLLPDFAQDLEHTPRPAEPGFLEGPGDGTFGQHACRIPLRLGTDYAVSGDPRAARIAAKINAFARRVSGGDPAKLRGGYSLDGRETGAAETLAVTAPLAVSAMVEPEQQVWLDALWSHLVERAPANDTSDTLKMLSLLVVSGNWWAPEKVPVWG